MRCERSCPFQYQPVLVIEVIMEGICSVCEKQKKVHRNCFSGKLVCWSCKRKDPSTHKKCSRCGQIRPVQTRLGVPIRGWGTPLCPNCYETARRQNPSTHRRCAKCGKTAPVAKRTDSGEPICVYCYGKQYRALRRKSA